MNYTTCPPCAGFEQQAWNRTTCSSGAGFEQQVRDTNQSEVGRRNGGTMLSQQGSERALLCFFMERLHALDVDALVGHNVAAFDLDVLLHRMQHHKVGAPVKGRHWHVDMTSTARRHCRASPEGLRHVQHRKVGAAVLLTWAAAQHTTGSSLAGHVTSSSVCLGCISVSWWGTSWQHMTWTCWCTECSTSR